MKRVRPPFFSVVFKYSNIACNVSIKNTVWAYLSLLILFGTYFYTHVSLISDLKVTSSKAPFTLLFYWRERGKKREWIFCGFSAIQSTDEPGICWMSRLVGDKSEVKVWRSRLRSRPNCKAVLHQRCLFCLFLSLSFFFFFNVVLISCWCVNQIASALVIKKEEKERKVEGRPWCPFEVTSKSGKLTSYP